MAYGRKLVLAIAFLGVGSASAQQALPDAPFKSIHLMMVIPSQEAALKTAVQDFNQEFVKQGCSTCGYHLFKMIDGTDARYSYLMIAEWPGGEVYRKIHSSAGFAAVTNRNPVVSNLGATELYGRYVDAK